MSGKSDVLVTELRKAVSLVVVQYYATCYVSEHRNHHILELRVCASVRA